MTKPVNTEAGNEDALLDSLFDEARTAAPVPSASLLERIAADARNQQAPVITMPAGAPQSLLSRVHDALGGWTGVGGLAAATVAGFYIGFAQPSSFGLALPVADEVDVSDLTSWTDSSFWPLDELSFEEG